MSDEAEEERRNIASKPVGDNKERNSYDQLQSVRTELDLVRFSEGIEDDLLEASLEEYQ